MTIKYSEAELKHPLRPLEPARIYARAQAREVIDIWRISEEVAWGTSMTSGDVRNIIRGLATRIPQHLRDGDIVSLGDLGKFQCQISSRGADSMEKFTHHNIEKVRIQFRPGKLLQSVMTNAQFENILPLKAKKEAKKEESTSI